MKQASVLAVVLALAGCQATLQPYGVPGFVLAPERGGPAALVAPAAIPIAIGEQARGDAALTVDVRSALPPAVRRLMATLADVAKVSVRVQGAGVDQTLELTKAQLDGGTTSVTFANLPAGPYQVTVRALNAASAVIGSDIRQATVTAGQTTTVQASVKLDPTIATPRTLPSPTAGTGGSGGGGATTGSLTTTVTLRADVPVHHPPILGTYAPAGQGAIHTGGPALAVDAEGHAWTNWLGDASIARVSPAGQVVVQADAPANAWGLTRSRDGQRVYFPNASRAYMTLAGTLGPAVTGVGNVYADGSVAPDGTLYFNTSPMELMRVSPAGVRSLFYSPYVSDHAVDAAGDVWVLAFEMVQNPATNYYDATVMKVIKFAPDGTVLLTRVLDQPSGADLQVPAWEQGSLELDAAGQPWIAQPARHRLFRLTSAGDLRDVKAFPGGTLYADPRGRMWANALDNVGRLDADGELVAWYHVAAGINPSTKIGITADDRLWVAAWEGPLIQIQLDPPPGD